MFVIGRAGGSSGGMSCRRPLLLRPIPTNPISLQAHRVSGPPRPSARAAGAGAQRPRKGRGPVLRRVRPGSDAPVRVNQSRSGVWWSGHQKAKNQGEENWLLCSADFAVCPRSGSGRYTYYPMCLLLFLSSISFLFCCYSFTNHTTIYQYTVP